MENDGSAVFPEDIASNRNECYESRVFITLRQADSSRPEGDRNAGTTSSTSDITVGNVCFDCNKRLGIFA